MKTNKSYKEAILRAYPTEKDTTQDQERLLALKKQVQDTGHTNQSPVIETHKNIMRSWFNLRGLDQHLAEDAKDQKKAKTK